MVLTADVVFHPAGTTAAATKIGRRPPRAARHHGGSGVLAPPRRGDDKPLREQLRRRSGFRDVSIIIVIQEVQNARGYPKLERGSGSERG